MSVFTKILLILSIALSLTSACSAQGDPAIFRTTFTALSLDKRIEELSCLTRGETASFDVFTRTRSELIKYEGPKTVTFFRETGVDSDGNIVQTPSASVTLTGNHDRYLIFFARGKEEGKYNAFAIPDSTSDFSIGTYRFINLAPFKIAVQVADKRFMIKERNFADLHADFSDDRYHETVMVSLPEGEDPLPCYRGTLEFNPRLRMLYIIHPKERGRKGRVRFVGIPETVIIQSE